MLRALPPGMPQLLEHLDLKAALQQFMRRTQARHAAAKDHDLSVACLSS